MGDTTPTPAPAAPAPAPTPEPEYPSYGASMVPNIRLLLPQVVVAGVFPVIAYHFLRPHVSSDAVALAAVMVFPVAEIVYERLHRGRFEPVGIIVLIGIAAGLIGALALHGSALLLKIRESMLSGVFGAVCLLSLAAPRPAMFYLGRAFATGGDAEEVARFNEVWDFPTVPRRFRLVTAVWGVALLAETVFRTVLAVSIPTQTFLVVSQVISWVVIGGLLWFSVVFSRQGEERVRALVEASPEAFPPRAPDPS